MIQIQFYYFYIMKVILPAYKKLNNHKVLLNYQHLKMTPV